MIRARTKSEADTRSFAAALADVVEPRDLLLLAGSMGAGKTAFAKGFGEALGVQEPITSPTFVLLRSYEARIPLHHADIYRLDHLQEVIDLGLMELLDEGGVALVEWGQLAEPVLPRDFLEVRINVDENDDDMRHFVLTGVGPEWQRREGRVAECLVRWTAEEEEAP